MPFKGAFFRASHSHAFYAMAACNAPVHPIQLSNRHGPSRRGYLRRPVAVFPFPFGQGRGDGALSSATINSRLAACRVFSLERHARHPALHRGTSGGLFDRLDSGPGFLGRGLLHPVPVQRAPRRTVVVPSDSMPGAARGPTYEADTQASALCSAEMTSHDNALG